MKREKREGQRGKKIEAEDMRQKSSWILTECQTCMPVIEVCSQYTIKRMIKIRDWWYVKSFIFI